MRPSLTCPQDHSPQVPRPLRCFDCPAGSGRLSATPITYNLTLTPAPGSLYGGTGSITIENAPRSSGISDYTQANGKLDDLTFTLDNQTFTLSGATGTTLVRFLNGQLNDITFAETIGPSPNRFTLDTTSGYAFYYNNGRAASYGTMSRIVFPPRVGPCLRARLSRSPRYWPARQHWPALSPRTSSQLENKFSQSSRRR